MTKSRLEKELQGNLNKIKRDCSLSSITFKVIQYNPFKPKIHITTTSSISAAKASSEICKYLTQNNILSYDQSIQIIPR